MDRRSGHSPALGETPAEAAAVGASNGRDAADVARLRDAEHQAQSPADVAQRHSSRPGARVRDIMRANPVQISADERLSMAEEIMTLGGVRHIPVVRAGELVGVLSERDLLRASMSELVGCSRDIRRAFLQSLEIGRVMSKPVIVISPETSVAEAAHIMAEAKIGCLPVVDPAGKLTGLVTETDLLLHFAGEVGETDPAGG